MRTIIKLRKNREVKMKLGLILFTLIMIAVGVLEAAPGDRFKGAFFDGYAMQLTSNNQIPQSNAGTLVSFF
jgi:hypothetical protein